MEARMDAALLSDHFMPSKVMRLYASFCGSLYFMDSTLNTTAFGVSYRRVSSNK